MADEATITSSLAIRIGNLIYQSQPPSFRSDVTLGKGPAPGAFTVSTSGTDVDFSQLDNPDLCRMMNLDEDNYVEWGPYDVTTDVFYPIGKLRPGDSFVVRLAGYVFLQESTGTGTQTGGYNSTLRFRANTASCVVLVEAFDE